MQQLILILIFISGFFTTPKNLLFYDQPEYLKIVSNHSFWQVLSLGHFPIHPIFLAIFWITSRITIPNYTALIFGVLSGILMYQISKIIFKKGSFWLAAVIFLLFPGVWLVNTNLMIQSVLLTFYLLSTHLFLRKKYWLFAASTFLMMGIHVDAIYWIPTIFLFPVIFKKEIGFDKKVFVKFIKLTIISAILSVASYVVIYLFLRKDFGGSTEQILAYNSFGILRILRNIWYSMIYNFGYITSFVLLFLIVKNVRSRIELLAWTVFTIAISIGGAYWEGDLMMRRVVFGGVIISLLLYKYLKGKSIFIVLYLVPIIIALAPLYYIGNSKMLLSQMQNRVDELPKNEVLLQSHYYQPFTKYDGKILWIGADNLDQIDTFLKNGFRVFITKESVTAPYRLVVGNNYHITSFDKVGESESRFLFKKYELDKYGDNLELKIAPNNKIAENAGLPVMFFNNNFWTKLSRNRIDYGDIGSWLWAVVTNHRDPTGWTYKDVRGIWYNM